MSGLARGVVLAAALWAVSAFALPDDTWVVSIGNNEGASHEVSLLYAERDAREVAEALRVHGPVASRRSLLLLGESATGVRRALQDVNAAIRERAGAGQPTALVVFYSGHADATALHLGGEELPFDELRALVQGSPAGVRLLIVDACRSGVVTRVKGVKSAESFRLDLQDTLTSEGMAIVTSSAAGETSQESDRLQGSFFTHHLINALRGAADGDGDGKVTLPEAYAYTYALTLRSSGDTLSLQHPTYAYDVKGKGQLVLSAPGLQAGRFGRLTLGERAVYLVRAERDTGPVVAELAPMEDARVVVLPAGQYFVQQRRPAEYREYEVSLPAGGGVDLRAAPYREVKYDRLVRSRGGERRSVQSVLVLGGASGELLAGEGPGPVLQLGFGLDLEWASVGARLRGSFRGDSGVSGFLPHQHQELGVGLTLQRFVDLPWLTVGFGVLLEGAYHRQSFSTARDAPGRSSFGASFAGLFSVERALPLGLSLRLEGGPVAAVLNRAQVDARGVVVGSAVSPAATWFLNGGATWRF
ncbi:MAG: caspase family protein [Myxococcaceae bacterium]|nr:caspase family protein [Myxococcaceae bacterium]